MPKIEIEASLSSLQTNWITQIDTRKVQIGCWLALIAIAAVRAWFTRYSFLGGDSVSNLDIGRLIADGHWSSAVNAYWSPGYPVIVSVFLWLVGPSAYWECPLVHLVNVLIFVGALASFQLFWKELRRWHEDHGGIDKAVIPENAFWMLGYSTFAIATLTFVPVALVNPDLLVAAFCCLAGWSALRFRRAPCTGHALLLGLVLALGYYAKTLFFPMGILFTLCACLAWPLSRRMFLLGATALTMFLLVSAPFIAALSHQKGRLTFGDSARLSQAWFVNGVEQFQWQGETPGSGRPVHPTRKLNAHPAVYEFAAKGMGTYPPWFDPSYWYEGVNPHSNWKLQAKIFVNNTGIELRSLVEFGGHLLCVALILAFLTSDRRGWTRAACRLWFLWLPGMAALLMYALVHVETRYLGGWLILLFAAAFCASSLPAHGAAKPAVGCIGLAVLMITGAALALQASEEATGREYAWGRSPRSAAIALYLLSHGLHEGDPIAVVGNGSFAYWPHLARLQVVAEVHPLIDFFALGEEQQAKALGILERTGAKAVIADPQQDHRYVRGQIQFLDFPLPSMIPPPWQKIDGTNAYVVSLRLLNSATGAMASPKQH